MSVEIVGVNVKILDKDEYGYLASKFYKSYNYALIAASEGSQLAYFYGRDLDEDPFYSYVKKDGTEVKLGPTGRIMGVYKWKKEGLSYKREETILERSNAYGKFQGQTENLEERLDAAYNEIRKQKLEDEKEKRIMGWTGKTLLQSFEDFKNLYDPRSIIPEYSDIMNVFTATYGCPNACGYCQLGGEGMQILSKELVEKEMDKAKELELKYYSNCIERMQELFINSSDILLLHIARKAKEKQRDLTSLEERLMKKATVKNIDGKTYSLKDAPLEIIPDQLWLIQKAKERFPETIKTYVFEGTEAVLETETEKLKEFHKEIYCGIIGWEMTHDRISRALGKNVTNQQKVDAVRKMQETGLEKIKITVQPGLIDEGILYDDKMISAEEGIDETVENLAEVIRIYKKTTAGNKGVKGDQALISKTIVLPGTKAETMRENGKIRPYSNHNGYDAHVDHLIKKLNEAMKMRVNAGNFIPWKQIQERYEIAIQK